MKENMKKLVCLLLILVGVFYLGNNTKSIITYNEPKLSSSKKVTLSKTNITCKKGETVSLNATASDGNTIKSQSSSDKSIATIERDKVNVLKCINCVALQVHCKSAGKVTITVKDSAGVKASTTVTVKSGGSSEVEPISTGTASSDISLDQRSISCKAGDSKVVVVKGAYYRSYTADKSIATVSVHPTLKADCVNCTVLQVICVKQGKTTLTAETKAGKKATANINVSKKSGSSTKEDVEFDKSSYVCDLKNSKYLYVNISTKNGTISKVESSDTKVATITLEPTPISKGKYRARITCLQDGSARITATDAKNKKATVKMTVKNGGTINMGKDLTCRAGEKTKINITVLGTTAGSYVGLKSYHSSNDAIASVSAGTGTVCNGCITLGVTCRAEGKATLTATSELKATGKVKVTVNHEKSPNAVRFLNSNTKCVAGSTVSTTVTAGSDKITEVKSSNTSIAKVSVKELPIDGGTTDRFYAVTITCSKKGTATITAKSEKKVEGSTKVTVEAKSSAPEQDEVKFEKSSVTCTPGEKVVLHVTSKLGTITGVSTSNNGIATVKSHSVDAYTYLAQAVDPVNGVLRVTVGCTKVGTATITAKSSTGAKGTAKVIVKDKTSDSKVAFAQKYTCKPGQTIKGLVTITNSSYSNGHYETITSLTSSDKAIATIGMTEDNYSYSSKSEPTTIYTPVSIRCIKNGTVTLTAKTNTGSSGTTKLTVSDNGATPVSNSISFDKGEYECTVGKTIQVTVNSTGGTIASVKSDNTMIGQLVLSHTGVGGNQYETRVYKLGCLKEGETKLTAISTTGAVATATLKSKKGSGGNPNASLEFSNKEITCKEGNKIFLRVLKTGGETISTLKTSDKSIATVEKETRLTSTDVTEYLVATCLKAGKATLTATGAKGSTATTTVTVKAMGSSDDVYPTGIQLNADSAILKVGETKKLAAKLSPSNVTMKTVTWSSSNNNIVTVDNGSIKGVAVGSAIITALTSNGYKATAIVTVKPTDVTTSMKLDVSSIACKVGETVTITATGTSAVKTYKSSDEAVATIKKKSDTQFTVTCVKEGRSSIIVKGSDGASASVTATVSKKVETSMTTNPTSISCTVGETKKVTVSGTSSVKDYTSKDTKIAGVNKKSASEYTISCVKKGSTTVEFVGTDGAKASLKVTVGAKATSLKADPSNVTCAVGDSKKVTLSGTSSVKDYASKDTKIAGVNKKSASEYTIKCVKKGSTTVEFVGSDGAKASVSVTVNNVNTSLTASPSSIECNEGETKNVAFTGTSKVKDYASKDTSVAGVNKIDDNNFKITCVKKGSTKVDFVGVDGASTAVTVKVSKAESSSYDVTTDAKFSNYSVEAQYQSSTMNYKIIKEGNYRFSLIHVEDAYKQFGVVLACDDGSCASSGTTLMQKIRTERGAAKGIIAVNASFFQNNGNRTSHLTENIVVNKGKLVRNYGAAGGILGIGPDGTIQYLHRKTAEEVMATQVLYTAKFSSPISADGGGQVAARTQFCQIDKNNFVLASCPQDTVSGCGNKMFRFGCSTGYNFDGGGSQKLYHRPGNGAITSIIDRSRLIPDMLYFVEQ